MVEFGQKIQRFFRIVDDTNEFQHYEPGECVIPWGELVKPKEVNTNREPERKSGPLRVVRLARDRHI